MCFLLVNVAETVFLQHFFAAQHNSLRASPAGAQYAHVISLIKVQTISLIWCASGLRLICMCYSWEL